MRGAGRLLAGASALALIALAPQLAVAGEDGAIARAAYAAATSPNLAQIGQISQFRPLTIAGDGNSFANYDTLSATTNSSTSGGYGNTFGAAISDLGDLLSYANGYLQQRCDITPGAGEDICGNAGQSGQILSIINSADLTINFPSYDAVHYCPDVRLGDELTANDIAAGESAATIEASIQNWIQIHQTKCPGIKLDINTPAPDGRIASSPPEIAVWKAILAYDLSLDDNKTIFVTNVSGPIQNGGVGFQTGYMDPANPSQPWPGYTFLSSLSESLTGPPPGLHTRQNAASIRAYDMWQTIKRMVGRQGAPPQSFVSGNPGLTGNGPCGTGKFSGTCFTGLGALTAPSGALATAVGAAGNPGPQKLTLTTDPGTPNDTFAYRLTWTSALPSPFPSKIAPYMPVTIVSGASSVGLIAERGTVTSNCTTFNQLSTPISPVSSPTVLPKQYYNGQVVGSPLSPRQYPGPNCTPTGYYVDLIVNTAGTTPIVLSISGAGHVVQYDAPAPALFTPPTVASGFGTSPSINPGAKPAAFALTVGTGGSASSGVLTLGAAINGWSCQVNDVTNPGGNATRVSAQSTTSVSLTNYSQTTGSAVAWSASDVLQANCQPY